MDTSIPLPLDESFHTLENAAPFAIDIGGTFTKVAYYSTVQYKVKNMCSDDHTAKEAEGKLYEVSVQRESTARLHFITFGNAFLETFLDFMKDHLMNGGTKVMKATGGGARKFKGVIENKLGLKVDEVDEMACSVKGCEFVLRNIPDEAFVYAKDADTEFQFQKTHPDVFPYLLVNLGSCISIFKVESVDTFSSLGGSLISGRTFWGLGKLLTKAKSFDELIQLALKGKNMSVDLVVKDIYGGSCGSIAEDLVACSFGKTPTANQEFSKEDLAASLLHMISHDIGQLALLHAKQHNVSRVYFGGLFTRGNPLTMHVITTFFTYKTKGDVQALFLRHGGNLGAIGAFLTSAAEDLHFKGEENREIKHFN